MKIQIIPFVILAAWLANTLSVSAQSAPDVSARLQPATITLDDAARLEVKLSGSDASARPQLPEVDGLNFQAAGQSNQIRIVNGRMSSSTSFSFHVTADKEGQFTIPPISVRSATGELQTEPLTLQVNASQGLTAPKPSAPPTQGAASPSPQGLAFLQVDRADTPEREHLYVGEMTPIAIRAYFRDGVQVSLNSRPALAEGSFTLRGLSEEPEQQRIEVDGESYRVLTWYGGLTGVKDGDFDLKASLEATIGVPQKRQAPSRSRGFGDPFFDGFFDDFFARVEHRDVSLESDSLSVAVQALPDAGRPEHFSGAVGQFAINSFNIPADLHTGDPATMRVTVSGKGNFDRVALPALLPDDAWKLYRAKDSFDTADSIGLSGEKRFEVPVIAQEPGTREVKFSLAYFDPEKGDYQVAEGEAVSVAVVGEPVSANAIAEASTDKVDGLAPLRSDPGPVLANMKPLYQQGWFIAAQTGTSLAFLSVLGIAAVRRHRQVHPEIALLRKSNKAIAEQLVKVEDARIQHDVPAFFAAGRLALQFKLTQHWSGRPEAITTEEVVRRLSPEMAVAHFFAMADAVEFASSRPDPEALDSWRRNLEQAASEIDGLSTPDPQPGKTTAWGQVATSHS